MGGADEQSLLVCRGHVGGNILDKIILADVSGRGLGVGLIKFGIDLLVESKVNVGLVIFGGNDEAIITRLQLPYLLD